MAWADNLNILLNMQKLFSDKGQASKDRSLQYRKMAADSDAQRFGAMSEMGNTLLGTGQMFNQNMQNKLNREQEMAMLGKEQAFEKPYKDTTAEMQRAQQALAEKQASPEYQANMSEVLSGIDQKYKNMNYIYGAHKFEIPGWGLTVDFDASANEVDHQKNVLKVEAAIEQARAQWQLALAREGKSGDKDQEKEDFRKMYDEIMALNDPTLLPTYGGGFFDQSGMPTIEGYNNNYVDWFNALQSSDTYKGNLSKKIKLIIDKYGLQGKYKPEMFIPDLLLEWEGPEAQEATPTVGPNQDTVSKYSLGASVLNWGGTVDFFRNLASKIGILPKADLSVKEYRDWLPKNVSKQSQEEQALNNMAKIAETLINKKKQTATQPSELQSLNTELTTVGKALNYVNTIDFDTAQITPEVQTDINNIIQSLEDIIQRYNSYAQATPQKPSAPTKSPSTTPPVENYLNTYGLTGSGLY